MRPQIGIIGAGFIGRHHSRALRDLIRGELVDARYVGVCDREEERARAFAEIAGLDLWTADADELIASPEINAIYICTPTAGHSELVRKAAEAGKHVFSEKPLAQTAGEAQEMLDAIHAGGVRHQVGLVLRHSPVCTVLKDLMSDPKLGRLMTVIFRDDQVFPIDGHYASRWRADASISGGGTLIEHSIHDIDLLEWLAGTVESVQAHTRSFAGREGIEDLANVTFQFKSGATGQLSSIWHKIADRASGRLLECFFERGYFAVEEIFFGAIRYETDATRGPATLSPAEVRERYLALTGVPDAVYEATLRQFTTLENYHFIQSLAEDRDPAPGFEIGVRAHQIVDAAYRSAAAGGASVSL